MIWTLVLLVFLAVAVAPVSANNAIRRLSWQSPNLPIWTATAPPYATLPLTNSQDDHPNYLAMALVSVPVTHRASDTSGHDRLPLENHNVVDEIEGTWIPLYIVPGTDADLRVSWPATTAIAIDMAFFAVLATEAGAPPLGLASDGGVLHHCVLPICQPVVRLRAVWDTAISATEVAANQSRIPEHVQVHVVTDDVILGIIPATILPALLMLVMVIPVAAFGVYPLVLRQIMPAVGGDDGSSTRKKQE
ncbi:hypothetical protein BC828DRAFT_404887 [Blastocladiella britannica]|nr:hypothetical protein BC828DRAFT_404887 [Blastocladiella britannica]